MMKRGWFGESYRHRLAANGVKTGYFASKHVWRGEGMFYHPPVQFMNQEARPISVEEEEVDECARDPEEFEKREDVCSEIERRHAEEQHRYNAEKRRFDPMRPVDTREELKGKEWRIERKYDGTRMEAQVDDGKVRLINRRGADKTMTYPELQELGEEVKGSAVLDGEVVAFNHGKDNFKVLSERDHLQDKEKIKERVKTHPVRYIVFDILKRNGEDVRKLPYREREQIIDKLVDKKGYAQRVTKTTVAQAKKQGAEGVVYKNLDAPYVYGKSKDWRKLKFKKIEDAVAVGYVPGEGKRKGLIGALKIAHHGTHSKVGTGFTDAENRELKKLLDAGKKPIVRIEYLKRGSKGALREPAFIGLRTDITRKEAN
jgi:bifunctional non-homologous end joining protein LigD